MPGRACGCAWVVSVRRCATNDSDLSIGTFVISHGGGIWLGDLDGCLCGVASALPGVFRDVHYFNLSVRERPIVSQETQVGKAGFRLITS